MATRWRCGMMVVVGAAGWPPERRANDSFVEVDSGHVLLRSRAEVRGEAMAAENRQYPVPRTCPHCGSPEAKLMPPVNDHSEYRCPECGTYRISGTTETLVENGQVDPVAARIEERSGYRWLVE